MKIRAYIFAILFVSTGMFYGQLAPDSTASFNETVILYTDRDVYIAGETIWFKADYLVNQKKQQLELSKVLYIELFTFNGQSLTRNKFRIENNTAEGKLEIPLGIQSDYYLLSAYTAFQAGGDPSGFFNLPIAVINPKIPLAKNKTDDSWSFKIAALSTADIVSDENEYALLFNQQLDKKLTEAQVVDTGGNLISEIKLFKNGLGLIRIVPEFNESYFLRTIYNFTDTINQAVSFDIPDNSIYTEKDKDNIFINLDFETNPNSTYQFEILSQANEIIYSQKIDMSKGNPVAKVPLSKMGRGINYFLLKNENEELSGALAEFFWPEPSVKIKLDTDKKTYKQRDQVQIKIEKKEKIEFSDPLILSVIKNGTVFEGENLPGYLIKNPKLLYSFFSSHPVENHSVKTQVKLLMALHNLNLLKKMKDLLMEPKTTRFLETRGASLSGLVRNRATKEPAQGVEIIVSVLGENPQLKIFTTNNKGEFIFGLNHIQDLTNIYLTLNNQNADSLEILVFTDFMGKMPDLVKPELQIDTSMKMFIEEMYVNAQLTELYGGEKSDSSIKNKAIRFSEPGISVVLDDYVPMASLELVFNELVPYVRVRKKGENYSLEVLDDKTNVTYDKPLILVDNLPVFDVGEILKLHPSIVEKIEVINSTYVYGDHILKGIVLMTTNTNNFGDIKLPESFTSLEFVAPASVKKILPSDYFKEATRQSRQPDFRNTLYFSGESMMSEKDITVKFYAPDNLTSFDVIIRGIAKDGKTVFGSTSFEVTK